MIDPMIWLAFSIHSNKGAYALLLGSGISRASGIPTGWEVTVDIIRKLAKLEGDDCEPDPAAWFRVKHSAEPDYSKLLGLIAKSRTERKQLLREYFEPSEAERNQGLKSPSAAHKAIARLVAAGSLRIIVTTNFDRLMERALEELGVTPTVISTADQVIGALPLAHSGPTVIKLHGDYLDTRIRNTAAELATYAPSLNNLLDGVLDEYGLIVCGWSAEWDVALRAAIERCPSHRFTTYWTTRGALGDAAKRLVQHRRAQTLQIQSADKFFASLQEKVQALDEISAPHPLSSKLAVAALKRFLLEDRLGIRIHDILHDHTEVLLNAVSEQHFPLRPDHPIQQELPARLARYEALCRPLLDLLSTGCFWGQLEHVTHWPFVLERLVDFEPAGGLTYLLKLRFYPALLLTYASGISALASQNYDTFAALVTTRVTISGALPKPLCSALLPHEIISQDFASFLPHAPTEYVYEVLRPVLRPLFTSSDRYDAAFGRFEYMYGLVHAHLNREPWAGGWWGPSGSSKWRRAYHPDLRIPELVANELRQQSTLWPPLAAGLFGGDVVSAQEAVINFNTFLKNVP